MMEFNKDKFTHFTNSLKANDISKIKFNLCEMIMFFKGDRNKIMEAVNYARSHSSFNYEEHKATTVLSDDTNSDKFYTEKNELMKNFSKERLEKVIELYPLMEKEDNLYNNKEVSPTTITNSNKNLLYKVVIIGAGLALLTLYLCQNSK